MSIRPLFLKSHWDRPQVWGGRANIRIWSAAIWANWFFIGSVFTTLPIEPDSAEVDHCGSCRSCITACPTDAFPAPYQLDARRCISYLTIEHSGPVDVDLRGLMGNRIYGCDDCLAACPWNKFAKEASDIRYHARADLMAPNLGELAMLDDAAFRAKFSGRPDQTHWSQSVCAQCPLCDWQFTAVRFGSRCPWFVRRS